MVTNAPAITGVLDRQVPFNLDAEISVLGSLLIDRDAIIKIAAFLKPADFYSDTHSTIYEFMLDLYNRREPGDFVTLHAELQRNGKSEFVGGPAYLTSLANNVPTSVHIEYYARIVERTAVLRRLISAGGHIASLGYREDEDVEQVLDEAEQLLFGVTQRQSLQDFVVIKQVLETYFDRIDELHQNRGELVGVPTGFVDLDQLTGGLQPSDLVIVAARPSVGKSSFSFCVAYNAAVRASKKVAVFSLEMSREQLAQRLLAMETGIDTHRLRLGYVNDDEWHLISSAFGTLAQAPIYIDDTPGLSVSELRSKARRLHAQVGCDLIIIDYLQLMQGRRSGGDNRVQEVSEITRGLKLLARELNVPVIACAQLSRAVESRQSHIPMLSDLRESGCLAGESLVYLPDSGTYKRVDQLVGQSGFNVLALNTETWQLEPRPVSRAFATGFKPVFRLTTRLGRTIRATANHKFLTIHGWQRLDELAPQVRLAIPRQIASPQPQTMRDEELALLGHLIGDGCTLPRHAIQYTTNDPILAEIAADLAVEVFGSEVKPRIQQERTWYQVYLSASDHLTHGKRNPITDWLDKMGIFGLRSYEKRIPDAVFAQPAAGIAIFLRHLWSTDGCINLSQGVKHYANIYYASSSMELAQQVQSLLLRLGINATLTRHPQVGKGRDQYHVTVSGKLDIERFFACIGGLGQNKTAHQAAIAEYMSERVSNTNRDVIPREIWRMHAVPAMQASGITSRQMQAALGNAYCGTGLYKQNVSRERAARLAEVVRSEPLARMAQSDVYWDEIISIEPDGEAEVYDLTVDGLHNFVANDTVVHNSIEQDADIVMFIYREELYEPDTEKKGIAEIHVAKHRNGPTDVVRLLFQKETTRFVDLETHYHPE